MIDFPGFHWWLAKRARQHGIPVIYFVPPQLWAWASWRVKKMRERVDKALCTLPFEEAWFRERGHKIAPGTLDKKRSKGGGPAFLPFGRSRLYRESALRAYLLSRISGEFSNTSEMKVARSVARPNGEGI